MRKNLGCIRQCHDIELSQIKVNIFGISFFSLLVIEEKNYTL